MSFSRRLKKNRAKYIFIASFLAYPLLLFMIFYVYVNINTIFLGFQDITISGKRNFVGLKHIISFIKDMSGDQLVSTSLKNSLILYALSLFVTLPLSLLFSYCLYKKCFGHKIIRFIVLLPSIISTFVICLLFKKFVESAVPNIMGELGVRKFPNLITNNQYSFGTTAFYTVWLSFSTALIVYPNAMNEIDPAIMESGKVDGVDNMFTELRHLILPLIFPTISTFLITGVAAIFLSDGSLIAFFLYSAPPNTYNLGYFFTAKVMTNTESQYPYYAAAGLVMTSIMTPITYLVKYLLEKYGTVTEY